MAALSSQAPEILRTQLFKIEFEQGYVNNNKLIKKDSDLYRALTQICGEERKFYIEVISPVEYVHMNEHDANSFCKNHECAYASFDQEDISILLGLRMNDVAKSLEGREVSLQSLTKDVFSRYTLKIYKKHKTGRPQRYIRG